MMENIKIDITANGITTLATAGKYCDRNIDVEVLVEGGGGSGSSLIDSEGSVFMTVDGEVFCVNGNDRLVDVNELPLVESTSDNLVYKTPVKYTDTVYLVKSEPRESTINVIPYQVTETEVTAVDIGGAKMSGVVVIAGHTSVTSPVASTNTSITVYADMDGEWVYYSGTWLSFTSVIPSEFDASAYKGMTYDAPTTSSTPGLYLHFDEQYAPRKVTVTNVSDQYAAEGGSITVIYRDEIDNIDSPMVTSDELNPIVYIINDVAYTHNGSEFVEWCAPTLDSFLKGKRVAEPPTTDSADGVYFVRSVTSVSFGIPITNANIFQNIDGDWKKLGHRRVVDASKFPKPGETGVSGGGASRTFCNLFTVDSGAINDWSTIYRMIGNSVNIIIVDDHTSVESPIEWMNGTEITFYADNTNIWQYSNGAWSQGLGDRVYHGVVSTVPTESSPNGTYIYNQVIPYNRLKAEVIFGNKEGEYTLSAAIGEALGVPCSTILVDNHSNVGNPVESNETNICVYADETGAWAYADGAWVDVLAMLTGATVPYLGIVVSSFDLSNFMDTLAYTYVQEAVNGSIWVVGDGMCMDITSMLEAQLGLHATSYTVVNDHTAVTSPEVFDMTTMSGAVYVDDVDIWAYVPDMGGWNGLFYDIMGMPAEMPFFNVTEPPTSSSPSGFYFVPVELSTGDGTVDPSFVPYDKDLVYKVTTKEGETNLYKVYDIGNGTIKVQDERIYNAQFSGTLDFIFVEDHTTVEEPLISKEYNSTTYYVDSTGIWYLTNSGGWICKCSTYSIVSESPTVESAVGYYLVKPTESVSVGVADPDVELWRFKNNAWESVDTTIEQLETQVKDAEASKNFFDYAELTGSADGIELSKVTDTSITSMAIHKSVTSIGSKAFYYFSSLKNVTLPEGVISIGYEAFAHCYNLTSVEIPDSVTSIGERAFVACLKLTEFPIGNGVTTIGANTYANVVTPTALHIPASVVTIGDYAFECNPFDGWVSNVTTITFDENSKLKTIGDGAFRGHSWTSITIPDSVTSIGGEAFAYCPSLTNITLPDSVTSIGGRVFYNCSSLASIVIPDGVTSIESSTFYNCTSLTSVEIPDSVTSIGDYAFYNCSSLTSINIPDSVTRIGGNAFDNCSSLTSVYITDIVAWCHMSCGNATAHPLYYATNLYLNNELVTKLVIPDGVNRISNYSFQNCSNLESVAISDSVTIINTCAFESCSSLTSVEFGKSIDTIGDNAFRRCSNLDNIEIPDGVTRVNSSVFEYCTSLTSIEIPNSVTRISNSAFQGCTNLTSITFTGTMEQWNAITFGTNWNRNTGNYTIHCTDGDIAKE